MHAHRICGGGLMVHALGVLSDGQQDPSSHQKINADRGGPDRPLELMIYDARVLKATWGSRVHRRGRWRPTYSAMMLGGSTAPR